MNDEPIISRRDALRRAGCGFGMLALADLLAADGRAATSDGSSQHATAENADRATHPYAVRSPHHAARAKRVIFLYMPGGPSHVDLFDPKPRLAVDNGKPLPFEKSKLLRPPTGHLLESP